MSTPSLPLDGFTIIEFGQYIAVPAATQVLVDQGATVIKVEAPGGESARNAGAYGAAILQTYNRGKATVEIDLKSETGRRHARDLIAGATAVISNFKPGVLARHGLGADDLLERDPALVVIELSGFGENSARPGLDIAAQAESGIMWVTGESGREPQRVGFPLVDAAAGYVMAQLLTSALLQRLRTGVGSRITLSLWDVAIHLQGAVWSDYERTGAPPVRKGNGQPGAAPAADVYRVADGYVVISAYMDDHWRRLCTVLDLEDMVGDERFSTEVTRAQNRSVLTERIEAVLGHLTKDEVTRRLGSAGVVVGGIREYPEVFASRGVTVDGPFIPSRSNTGPRWLVGQPYQWPGVTPHQEPPRPVGADNDRLFSAAKNH